MIAQRQRRFDGEQQPMAPDVSCVEIGEKRVAPGGADSRQSVQCLLDLAAAPAP